MQTIPKEINDLCVRLGHARDDIEAGDEIVGLGCTTSMGHYLTHGKVIEITNGTARVKVIRDYYFSGGSFPRDDEEIDVSVEHLKKSIETRSKEHIDFLDWLAKEVAPEE